jgi:hypothetical protein
MTKKVDWKSKLEAAELSTRMAQQACHKLRIERDAEIRARNEAVIREAMQKTEGAVAPKIVRQPMEPAGVVALIICIFYVAGASTLIYKSWALDVAQNVQWRYVEGHTVYRPIKASRAIFFIKEASADIENRHLTKANDLLHDAVVDLESDEEGDPE